MPDIFMSDHAWKHTGVAMEGQLMYYRKCQNDCECHFKDKQCMDVMEMKYISKGLTEINYVAHI